MTPGAFLDEWLPRLRDMPADTRAGLRGRVNTAMDRTDLPRPMRLEAALLLGVICLMDDDGLVEHEARSVLDVTITLGEIAALPEFEQRKEG